MIADPLTKIMPAASLIAAMAGSRVVFRRPTAKQALATLCCMPFVQARTIKEESATTDVNDYLFTAMLGFTVAFFLLCSGIIGAFVGRLLSPGTSTAAPALQRGRCTKDAGTQTHFATEDAKVQTQVATTDVEMQTASPTTITPPPPPTRSATRWANDVATQSQCTYTALRGTQADPKATPRFLPLGEAATGVWRMGARAVGR